MRLGLEMKGGEKMNELCLLQFNNVTGTCALGYLLLFAIIALFEVPVVAAI